MFPPRRDRASKLLRYIGDVTVSGPEGTGPEDKPDITPPHVPDYPFEQPGPIFDSLNYVPNMLTAIDEVRSAGKIAEAAICYTGDILDPMRTRYDLNYYVDMAQTLERAGLQVLAIKDISGLLKPYAAAQLVKALRDAVSIPIHLHTHDTSGNGLSTLMMATEVGVDIADVAISAVAGTTSQPSWNSLVSALQFSDRAVPDKLTDLQVLVDYWTTVAATTAALGAD